MACSSGCPTQDHRSLGECLRSKGIRVAYCNTANNQDATQQKRWDRNIEAYKDARRQGIQPKTTKRIDVDAAVHMSNKTGVAFQG